MGRILITSFFLLSPFSHIFTSFNPFQPPTDYHRLLLFILYGFIGGIYYWDRLIVF
jgi:hypothetical protein